MDQRFINGTEIENDNFCAVLAVLICNDYLLSFFFLANLSAYYGIRRLFYERIRHEQNTECSGERDIAVLSLAIYFKSLLVI